MHTVKGTCGFLGLPRLESVAHAGENVLGKVRDGELEVTAQAVTLILACLDRIRSIMGDLEASGTEPAGDDLELIKSLNAFADGGKAPAAAAAPAAPAAPLLPLLPHPPRPRSNPAHRSTSRLAAWALSTPSSKSCSTASWAI